MSLFEMKALSELAQFLPGMLVSELSSVRTDCYTINVRPCLWNNSYMKALNFTVTEKGNIVYSRKKS